MSSQNTGSGTNEECQFISIVCVIIIAPKLICLPKGVTFYINRPKINYYLKSCVFFEAQRLLMIESWILS